MKKILLFLSSLCILTALLSGCFVGPQSQSASNNKTKSIPPLSYLVKRGNIVEAVSEQGRLEPLRYAEVVTENNGKIKEVLVQEGDTVSEGQPLFILDTEDLEISRLRAEANLRAKQAELAKVLHQPTETELRQQELQYQEALTAYQNARKNWERNQKLFQSGAISQEDLNNSEQEVVVKEASLRFAEAQLKEIKSLPKEEDVEIAKSAVTQAEADLKSIEKDIRSATITAPFSGTVLKIDVEQGETILAEETLAVVADLSTMKVIVPVNEADIVKVRPGQKAQVSLDAFPGQIFEGTVVSTSQYGKTEENVVTYDTIIHLDNSQGLLRSNMTADATIIIQERENTLLVPLNALQEEEGKTFVLVKRGEKENPEKRQVKVGIRSDTFAEIEEGVKKGEEILITLGSGESSKTSTSQQPVGPPPGGPGPGGPQ